MNDTPSGADRRKLNDALRRAIPVTRAVDHGVPLVDAQALHRRTDGDAPEAWDRAGEALAAEWRAAAGQRHRADAAQAWCAAAALLLVAQLAFNTDGDRKRALYAAARDAMRAHARCAGDVTELRIESPAGTLFGWEVAPRAQPAWATVVVIGGLSGWGAVYLDMARALGDRGIACILAEGPGQGSTRLVSGLAFGDDAVPLLRRFVDHAEAANGPALGIWGNSFGGLFAAHVAAADRRLRAVCINGAPIAPEPTTFRTALEQMRALFGTSDDAMLARRLAALRMAPDRHRIDMPVLVLEGGNDPLVPLGAQSAFFDLAPGQPHDCFGWPDGEHTLYNHAAERNARVAGWFEQQLRAARDPHRRQR